MAKEIEKKYLLIPEKVPDDVLDPAASKKIEQGYICVEGKTLTRIRIQDGRAIVGIKIFHGEYRDEFEYEIPMEEGKKLLEHCTRKLRKRRFSFSWGILHVDVDFYPSGLAVVELEFRTEEEAATAAKPPFCGKEISGSVTLNNLALASSGKEWGEVPHHV